MSRLKTSSSKSAKSSSYDKSKRRKKKSTPRRAAGGSSSSPSSPPPAPSSPLTITAPSSSMRHSVSSSAGSPSAGTPTSSRECEQCGNPAQLDVGANAKAVANCKKVAHSGCHVCDFVAYRKALRHCVVCDKTQCDVFCEWCGHGFHTKCAKSRGEPFDAPNGFCCKKCEAEQADDSDSDSEAAEANDVNAKCGECQKPFTSTAPTDTATTSGSKSGSKAKKAHDAADATGFKVNQSVLVENDEVLYNAVITDVDATHERIKIHFLRWSKSFDNWYAMDDERINESLACDCCNRWFHIGCLPPIKSSGRFKDTTYVCPTCLDDARGFYGGTRTTVTSTKSSKAMMTTAGAHANGSASAAAATTTTSSSSSSSRRKATAASSSAGDDAVSSSKKRSSKLVVQSESEEDDEEDEDVDQRPEPTKPKASKKASEKESVKDDPVATTKSKKRRRAQSIESNGSNGSEKRAKASASTVIASSPGKKSESEAAATTTSKRSAKSNKRGRDRSSSHEDDDQQDETKDAMPENDSERPDGEGDDEAKADANQTTGASERVDDPMGEPATDATKVERADADTNTMGTKPDGDAALVPSEEASSLDAALSMEKPTIKRKVSSGHSVSSLLNSPSSPLRASPALRAQAAPAPVTNPSTRIKVEKDPLALPSSSQAPSAAAAGTKKAAPSRSKVWVTGRDAKTAKAAAAAAAQGAPTSTSAGTARNPLSAFDILREVAAQSMSDEIDAPGAAMASATALPPAAAPSRRTQKARMTAAERKAMVKNEADKAASGNSVTTNGRTPPLPSSSSSSSSSSSAPIGVGIPMNSYVDLHFTIRKEMYLRICMLEDERLLERETAQLLRAMIYPTSDKFHDLKFVYVVNKELSSLQLTKRLLELVPITSGGTAPVIPMRPSLAGMNQLPHPPAPHSLLAGSGTLSAAPSPARPPHNVNANQHASPAPPGYSTPARTASPALERQPEREPEPLKPTSIFQLPTSIGFASATERTRPLGLSSTSSSTSSILTSVISPSSVIGPPMPPPLSTKLLLETMHKHSKFPTLLPPPPPPPAPVASVASSSSSSSSISSTSSSSVAVKAVPTVSTSSTSTPVDTSSSSSSSTSAIMTVPTAPASSASSAATASSSATTVTSSTAPIASTKSSAAPSPSTPSPQGPPPLAPPPASLANIISASISSN